MNTAVQATEESFISSPALLLQTAQRLADAPAYYVRGERDWQATSWKQYAQQVQAAACSLVALGVKPGDAVCILGFNRPEWTIMDLAAMMVGAVATGIYWTCAANEVEYIVQHSGAKLMLVESDALWKKLDQRPGIVSQLQHVVMMQGASADSRLQMSWGSFMALCDASSTPRAQLQATVEQRMRDIKPDTLGTLIYTSGTTGHAKAVMLTHHNLAWTSKVICDSFGVRPDDRLISYLPLAHIAEQQGAIHNHIYGGYRIYFAASIERLAEHLPEVHPTVFFGVPRVWIKMQAAIEAKLRVATGLQARMAQWALRTGQAWHAQRSAGQAPSATLNLQMQLARKLIFKKIQAKLGFDSARILISGAAPIAVDTLKFFYGLDLEVGEVYGLSEASGPISMGLPGAIRVGSTGRCIPGVELRIADDGEILARGPNVFQGYLNHAGHEGDAGLKDGWFHTGDLGRLDEDGYLYVTGRKKDILVTSGGKNISAANIESELMDLPWVEHAVVCGDGRHFLGALLTLKPDMLARYAQEHALQSNLSACYTRSDLIAQIQAGVDSVNERQARVAQIRKFALIERPLSIESGELTPTLKVKRSAVLERYAPLVDRLYAD